MNPKLEAYLKDRGAKIERALETFGAPRRFGAVEVAEAARYSLFAGGKRLRPALVLAAAEACGSASPTAALPAACALEMVHTYSLIHDDLPAMDDDDTRRGRPTNHRVYGEAMAILAGDALLTRAFGVIADAGRRGTLTPEQAVDTAALLAEAAGGPGMVGGQALDIQTGKRGALRLERIHRMKTAALITAACEAGAIAAQAPRDKRRALRGYGEAVGLAYQITDDLLDDGEEPGKLTYPAVHGAERSREEAARLAAKARRALAGFGAGADPLRWIADHIVTREK